MSIDIYAADEQHDETIDLEAWVNLANGALTDEGVRGLAEVSLIFDARGLAADVLATAGLAAPVSQGWSGQERMRGYASLFAIAELTLFVLFVAGTHGYFRGWG